MQTKDKLIHAVTEYDRKESKKRSYNRHAIGIYFQRVDEVCADIERGADTRKAIMAGFDGRLADACLRAVGLPITKQSEGIGGTWHYEPVQKTEVQS